METRNVVIICVVLASLGLALVAAAFADAVYLRLVYYAGYKTEIRQGTVSEIEDAIAKALPAELAADIVGVEVKKFLVRLSEVEAVAQQAAELAEQASRQ